MRRDGNEVFLALRPLHTTSYIDKGEASIILLALSLRPLHTTSYIEKDKRMGLLALQPLHTTSYIDDGERSCVMGRTSKAIKALLVVVLSFELI